MKLAVHLAKEVAAILRAVLTHETKKLYNDSTVHLLCSNYWIQPIYLHSSSRYNATREGERKRPSSGLARVAAYPKPSKQRKPSASSTGFCDWIGGTCYADTLEVWFPAHWAPVVLALPTVPVAFSEARFQVKKSACFWRHGRYQE